MTGDELLATEDDLRAHLAANFTDDLLYPNVLRSEDGKLHVRLLPLPYECAACRSKGFSPRLVEAFKQRIAPTWCTECWAMTSLRVERHTELTPRLLEILDMEFVTDVRLPGNAFGALAVSRKRACSKGSEVSPE